MKINKIIATAVACAFMVSCGDQLAEINENPNASLSASPAETFTSGVGMYGVALEAYYNEADAILAQYWAGGPGVALINIERYFLEPLVFNNEWSFSYLQALSDLSYTIENGNEAQISAAEIFSVLIFQNLVDHYGRIPYFDALKGDPDNGGVLNPAYDDGKVVYADLVDRLDVAIATLSTTDDVLGSEDIIYNGDVASWIDFANSLKLRLLMRQSITDPSVSTEVVNLVNNGSFINSDAGIASIPFAGAATSNFNPQYARREAGVGQFYVASNSTVNVMNDMADPRLGMLYTIAPNTGTITGLDQGNIQDAGITGAADYSYPSSVAYGSSNDVILMSHWEVMFLRAEADMRFNTADDETAMYNAAVQAHFSFVGAGDASAYLANAGFYNANASTDQKSNIIGVQKWISMNGLQEAEGWIESRRFDTPSGGNVFTNTSSGIFQTPTRSVFGAGQFPSIRIYPQTELDFNGANVPSQSLFDKVFWDN